MGPYIRPFPRAGRSSTASCPWSSCSTCAPPRATPTTEPRTRPLLRQLRHPRRRRRLRHPRHAGRQSRPHPPPRPPSPRSPPAAECLSALADDPAVATVALAVDLVPELDGDDSHPRAVLAAAAGTPKPVAVLAARPAAVDPAAAARLRAAGLPVLEGTRSGLLALRHLLDHAQPRQPPPETRKPRPSRWTRLLTRPPSALSAAVQFDLLRGYGIPAVGVRAAGTRAQALAAAAQIGYPVVLKTDERGSRTSRMSAGSGSAAAIPARPAPPTPTCPPGWARACWCARPPHPAPSWPWASSVTPPSVPSWSSAPAAFSSRFFLNGPSSSPRSPGRRSGQSCPGCVSPPCWPGPAASRPPTWTRRGRRRPGRAPGYP